MKLILLAVFCTIVFCSQYVPIMGNYPGFQFGNSSSSLSITLIYDPVCDDTLNFDQIWKDTLSQLGKEKVSKINLRYISFPLPYHLPAHKITQGLLYIQNVTTDQIAMSVLRQFLAGSFWKNSNLEDLTISEILDKIAQEISDFTQVDYDPILEALSAGSSYDKKTRSWAKFAMGQFKTPATPKLIINGVELDNGADKKSSELVSLINSLIK